MKTSLRKGFTLIELLVVIAIIAILAAILFPVFAQAREKARQTSCLSNEKQIGLAILQYTQDYDEIYPAGVFVTAYNPNTPSGLGWAGQCAPYIKSGAIFKCPDDSTGNVTVNGTTTGYPVSYGYNSNVAGKSDASLSAGSNTLLLFEVSGDPALVTDPSENTVNYTQLGPNFSGFMSTAGQGIDLLGKVTSVANGGAVATIDDATPTVQYATGAIGARFDASHVPAWFKKFDGLHNNGANYLAGDGHAKYMLPSHVSTGLDASTADCNQGNLGNQPSDCTTATTNQAAGTSNSTYTMTFSTQ